MLFVLDDYIFELRFLSNHSVLSQFFSLITEYIELCAKCFIGTISLTEKKMMKAGAFKVSLH